MIKKKQFPSAEKFLHKFLIAACLLRNRESRRPSRGEVSAGTPTGQTEVERCCCSTRQITHTHTHTHTELYNRTELSPVYRELKQLFDKILSTCLPIPHIHIFIAPPHSSTALKINRVRRFPHSSFLLFLHTHTNARAHTHAQESSCLQQETHSTLKERKSPYVSPREQIQS